MLERTGKPQADYQRVRGLIADEKGIKVGDETLDYLLDQVVEMLMPSSHVDEVYVEDVELRRKMAPVFKKHMAVDSALDLTTRKARDRACIDQALFFMFERWFLVPLPKCSVEFCEQIEDTLTTAEGYQRLLRHLER